MMALWTASSAKLNPGGQISSLNIPEVQANQGVSPEGTSGNAEVERKKGGHTWQENRIHKGLVVKRSGAPWWGVRSAWFGHEVLGANEKQVDDEKSWDSAARWTSSSVLTLPLTNRRIPTPCASSLGLSSSSYILQYGIKSDWDNYVKQCLEFSWCLTNGQAIH